jgi:phosphomannomutase
MPKIVLFDVDGTLTEPRKKAGQEMLTFLQDLRKVMTVGIVGGSDLTKIKEQLGDDAETAYDYLFSENGLMAHKGGKLLAVQSLKKHLGDDKLKQFINFTLKELAEIDIPVKRGTFIEFRNGMMNVSPVGRNCSQEERDAFEQYDKEHGIRKDLVQKLQTKFADFGLTYSVGGQISFDAFPNGWDKTFCLQFVENDFDEIHFFGDKTYKGGNDHEIYESDKTQGHVTTGPSDTIKQCKELFLK